MSPFRPIAVAAAAVALVASSATAAVVGPWSLAPGEYYTELTGSFQSAGSSYDNDGNRFLQDGLAETRGLTWYTELGWKQSMSIQLGLPALSVTDRLNHPQSAITSTGFGDFSLGLRRAITRPNAATAAALQLEWDAPAGYDSAIPPALGDGRQKLSAQLELGWALGKRGFMQVGGGYQYAYRSIGSRSTNPVDGPGGTDWADHVLSSGALGLWMGRVLVSGQYEGADAAAAGVPSAKTRTHLAGPRFTCRVDDRLDAFAGSWHTFAGQNDLHYDEFYAGLAWRQTKLNRLRGFLGNLQRP